ncbi:TetR/AcrR family transcriptional regulator [Segniliparus rotundus]|uniref:TetR/AcrR family transcriptional regulator n=1 Tax=Segniliparus rotundus TaxID=286802 RepID=UPI0002F69D9B|nr:TetR/AcrR family transcriptional regulator [Segniliparus rotundus]
MKKTSAAKKTPAAKKNPASRIPIPKRQRRPTRAEVRKRLLDAALIVFGELGYTAASLDIVAAAAGLTKGAVYSNFSSKDELYFAMIEDQLERRVAETNFAASGSADLDEISRFFTSNIFKERHWRLVWLEYWARVVREEELRQPYLQARQQFATRIKEAFGPVRENLAKEAAGKKPSVELTEEELATVLLAVNEGLTVQALPDPEKYPKELLGKLLRKLLS